MANSMNNYFSTVFNIELQNNVHTQLGQYVANILDTFNFSTEEVQEKLQNSNIQDKLCITLVRGKLYSHLEMRNLIGDSRHGFRNKDSCVTSLLDFFAQVLDT